MKWCVQTEEETASIAAQIASLLKKGDVVALNGTLGAGKTTFTRALIRHLMHQDVDVPSPTFTLLQAYDTPKFTLYHFDFYRLKSPEDAFEIGIEDAFANGVSFIEWPDRLGSLLPKVHKSISFEMLPNGSRQITTKGF